MELNKPFRNVQGQNSVFNEHNEDSFGRDKSAMIVVVEDVRVHKKKNKENQMSPDRLFSDESIKAKIIQVSKTLNFRCVDGYRTVTGW